MAFGGILFSSTPSIEYVGSKNKVSPIPPDIIDPEEGIDETLDMSTSELYNIEKSVTLNGSHLTVTEGFESPLVSTVYTG
jgi:hypothetical protein